jgi:2-haloacid dehalogenase/putative hydrolase of the HAD superfamily
MTVRDDLEGRPAAVLFDVDNDVRPKAVLFDVGNVVVRWDPATLYSKIFPDSAERERFLREVCTMAWHGETDRGLSFGDNIAKLSALHPHHAEAIAAWWARWPEMFSGTIPQTEVAIEALHARGVPIYGLTNMSIEAWPGVQAMSPAFSRFTDTIVSAAEGVIKPEPRIYEIVLERSGLMPQDFLFVDDNRPNIDAAEALGFHTLHFTDPDALMPTLERHGLL